MTNDAIARGLTASKMEDDEGEIISLSAGVVAIIALRRRKRRRRLRTCWVRQWISRRPRFGCYEALLKDIRGSDPKAYQNFCRMSPVDYDELLALVAPYITYQDTNYRKAISIII